jgi:hypothetical protein
MDGEQLSSDHKVTGAERATIVQQQEGQDCSFVPVHSFACL